MPFQVEQTAGIGAGQEGLIQTLVGQTERHIHPGTRILRNRVGVEIAGIDKAVEQLLLRPVTLLHGLDAALLLQPLEDQPREAPGEGRVSDVLTAVSRTGPTNEAMLAPYKR